MGMSRSGKGANSNINITPYIDILLVLLIIFMVIQPRTQYDLDARVPQKDTQEEIKKVTIVSDAIVVTIDKMSNLSINQEPVTRDQLGARLFDVYSARANRNLFIRGDGDLPFDEVVKVMDIAKGAGVGDIGLDLDGPPGSGM